MNLPHLYHRLRRNRQRPCSATAHIWSGVPLGVCLLLATEPVLAESPHSTSAPPGSHVHDGFYLRYGIGLGAYFERADTSATDRYSGRLRTQARGFAVASEFAMGGTPWEGVVLGGGVYTTEVYTSSVVVNHEEAMQDPAVKQVAIESRDVDIVGMVIDRYFVKTLGLHAQAALGIASQLGLTTTSDLSPGRNYTPVGIGLMLGLGYETWLSHELSLGFLARFGGAILAGRDDNEVLWVHYITTNPAFLVTVTYH